MDKTDKRIKNLMASGYSQSEIEDIVGIRKPALAQRIERIQDKEKRIDTTKKILIGAAIGALAAFLLKLLFKKNRNQR